MSDKANPHTPIPYAKLGSYLKVLRESHHESLAEVSGAVEIDEPHLIAIEDGTSRPSEDILILLLNHFEVQETKVAEIMQLAGYDQSVLSDDDMPDRPDMRQAMMIMLDPRVMYSDSVEVTANGQGVTVQFSQTACQGGPLTVSRIGMSREQAKIVMGLLHQVLYDLDNPTESKRLGGGSSD